ncbi:MAG: DUF2206 domain-containing protein [Halobacteriota archaeon]
MIHNPLRMNDWAITTTLAAVAVLQAVVWAFAALDATGVRVPVLQPLFVLVYLLFIPGMLVLRSLRLHLLGDARTLLYSVGLSIAILMFTGLFMNTVYPLVGIERPFSVVPVVLTVSAVVICLAAISYWRDRSFAVQDAVIDVRSILTSPAPALCLLPFVSILATYALNVQHTNVALLVDIVIIGVVALWAGGAAPFPKQWRALATFSIALALLYYGSLMTSYVWGWDIQKEVYNANAVLSSGIWNQVLPDATNSVISVTVLAPLISVLSGISVVWLFKIVYPLVFALVPLGIFIAVRTQTDDKIAFLAAFFVSSLFTFYGEMPALARQEIAELFFVLLLVLTVSTSHSPHDKRTSALLYGIFAASLVVSHYALALVFLVYVVIAWLVLFLVDNPALRRLDPLAQGVLVNHSHGRQLVTLIFILPFAAFTAVWYFSAGSSALAAVRNVVNSWSFLAVPLPVLVAVVVVGALVYGGALALIYFTAARSQRKMESAPQLRALLPLVALAALGGYMKGYGGVALNDLLPQGMLSPLHAFGLILYLASVLVIVIGLVAYVSRRSQRRFNSEFVALALAAFVVLAVATILPQLALSLNTTRLFHISTLLLAPFGVTGALFIAQPLVQRVHYRHLASGPLRAQRLVAVFFVVLFVFSTGSVYEVTHDGSTSFILNNAVDAPRFNDREIVAAQWISDVRANFAHSTALLPLYADAHRRALFDGIDLDHAAVGLSLPLDKRSAYLYLGTYNLQTGQVAQLSTSTLLGGTGIKYVELGNTTEGRRKIFDDGGSAIYL